MFCFDDLPNELYLILFSYLNKYELIESFYKLNQRINSILLKYFSKIFLRTNLTRKQIENYQQIDLFIQNLIIENYQIGKEFLLSKKISLKNLQLIDSAIDLYDENSVEILGFICTCFYSNKRKINFQSEKIQFEFLSIDYATNFLFEKIDFVNLFAFVEIRLIFSKLSEYFQFFENSFSFNINKLYISIFSIDQIDLLRSQIELRKLTHFQLEICEIPFELLNSLLPKSELLRQFAFIGRTTTINPKLWKCLLNKYPIIEQIHFYFSNIKSISCSNIQQWKYYFPNYLFYFNSINSSFSNISRSKFEQFNRILLNESIVNIDHIEYSNEISHLIIRSQYWCSFVELDKIFCKYFSEDFRRIKRLSTTTKQLELIDNQIFFNRIQQLDLEFSERYCYIDNNLSNKFNHLQSLCLTSIYDGSHEISLHSTVKHILFNQFPQLIYFSIDSIEINDEEQVEQVIFQWYSSRICQPQIKYIQGKILSIWF